MRRSQPFTIVSFSMSFALMATTSFALPTDLGRSADPQASAVRYLAAIGPETVQALAGLETLEGLSDDIFDVSLVAIDPSTIDFGRALEDEAFNVSLIAVDPIATHFSRALEDYAHQVSLNAVDLKTVDFPTFLDDPIYQVSLAALDLDTIDFPDFREDEAFQVSLIARDVATTKLPVFMHDAAFNVPLEPVSLASLDIPADLMTPALQATLATLVTPSAVSGPSSSRGDDDTLVTIAAVPDPIAPEDLMSDMVDADPHLILREGDADRPDTMMMSSDVLFAFGKAELEPDAQVTLATMIEKLPITSRVEVFGHTDAIGSEDNNLALGLKRAEAVRAWLLDNSELSSEQVVATGVGEGDPVALNVADNGQDNPDGRAQNRRVEFSIN